MTQCRICKKPITLVPSAKERAAKDISGKPISYYENLFQEHTECTLKERAEQTKQLMEKSRGKS